MSVAPRPLNVLSVCSGGGGLDLGLHLATDGAARAVVYVEREAYAAACLVARMEEAALALAPLWDDLCTFDGRPWRGVVDCVAGGTPCQDLAKERGHHDQLPNAVALWSGLPGPATSTGGPASSPNAQTSDPPRLGSRLNPAFVEWLMGCPEGWSLPVIRSVSGGSETSTPTGSTGSDCSETASCPHRPQPPGVSSGDTSSDESLEAAR